ncbi:uncharacterized protein [Diadema setosum]|uniref:uncharacterized protein n=1 Tax=Diadema setosum TaxID=31175 RepID=UPI003B3B05F9
MDVSWIKQEHFEEGEQGEGDGGENEGRKGDTEGNGENIGEDDFDLVSAEVSTAELVPSFLSPATSPSEEMQDGIDSDGFIEVDSHSEGSKVQVEEGDFPSGSEDLSEEEGKLEALRNSSTAHMLPNNSVNNDDIPGNSIDTLGNTVVVPGSVVDNSDSSADEGEDDNELYITFVRRDTGGQAFKCKECCKCFARRSDMIRHVVIHMRAENSTSQRNPKKCATYTALSGRYCQHKKDNIYEEHPPIPESSKLVSEAGESRTSFRCHKCLKVFGLKSSLRFHLLEHGIKMPSENMNKCEVCKKIFGRPSKLQRHLTTRAHLENVEQAEQDAARDTGLQVVQRESSEQVDSLASSRQQKDQVHVYPMHLTLAKADTQDPPMEKRSSHAIHFNTNLEPAVHSFPRENVWKNRGKPDRPLSRRARPCKLCGKYISNMTIHLRTHTGERPYKCDVCGKAFSDNGGLKRHMMTHTGKRPYQCHICYKTFSQSSSCRMHMSIHGVGRDQFMYRCNLCPAAFHKRNMLRKHVKREHKRKKGKKSRRIKDPEVRVMS